MITLPASPPSTSGVVGAWRVARCPCVHAQITPGGVQQGITGLTGFHVENGFSLPSGAWIWSLLRGEEGGGSPNVVSSAHPVQTESCRSESCWKVRGWPGAPQKEDSLGRDAGELGVFRWYFRFSLAFLLCDEFAHFVLCKQFLFSFWPEAANTLYSPTLEGKALHPPNLSPSRVIQV